MITIICLFSIISLSGFIWYHVIIISYHAHQTEDVLLNSGIGQKDRDNLKEKSYFDTLFFTQYIHTQGSLVIFYIFISYFFFCFSLMCIYCAAKVVSKYHSSYSDAHSHTMFNIAHTMIYFCSKLNCILFLYDISAQNC
jgi:hypothetical protein